uniref:Uncharacterized protein n=1 Tax=Rhizophora mucronata TaxID=61149 RepID=A0A2P2PKW5_RHIMU
MPDNFCQPFSLFISFCTSKVRYYEN